MALGLFTSLPVPASKRWIENDTSFLIPMFPWVGLLLGALWTVTAAALVWLELTPLLSALLLLFILQGLTGFIHTDGLMDTADAFYSRAPLEKRLSILKDPHVGSFAVIALVFVLLSQYAAFHALLSVWRAGFSWQPLLTLAPIPVVSRLWVSLFVLNSRPMATSEYAKSLSAQTTRWQKREPSVLLGLVLIGFAAAAVFTNQPDLLYVFAVQSLTAVWAFRQLYRSFNGISGDLAGFILVVSETGALLAAAILRG